jgi:hypothetical protein
MPPAIRGFLQHPRLGSGARAQPCSAAESLSASHAPFRSHCRRGLRRRACHARPPRPPRPPTRRAHRAGLRGRAGPRRPAAGRLIHDLLARRRYRYLRRPPVRPGPRYRRISSLRSSRSHIRSAVDGVTPRCRPGRPSAQFEPPAGTERSCDVGEGGYLIAEEHRARPGDSGSCAAVPPLPTRHADPEWHPSKPSPGQSRGLPRSGRCPRCGTAGGALKAS